MVNENFTIQWLYGVPEEIKSCPMCNGEDLRTDIVNIAVAGIIKKNWYCSKCKAIWVLGIKPHFKNK